LTTPETATIERRGRDRTERRKSSPLIPGSWTSRRIASGRSVLSRRARLGGVDDDGLVTELEKIIAKDVAEVGLVLDHENPHRWQSSTTGAEPTKASAAAGPARRVLY